MVRLCPVLILAVLFSSQDVVAETITKRQCLDDHVQAQETRQAGKLRLAREHLKCVPTHPAPRW
ncbi:MAG: hypothetical protein RMJ98_06805 [Myxococcales bacterium]|nr:hypothetical protein [Polyangiaceae bacterium]MDW8248995.1 hypothetical protein [Myxococcales bacterium]